MRTLRSCLAVLGALTLTAQTPSPVAPKPVAAPEERWKLQYFYDENKTELSFIDVQFPSSKRGIAFGAILPAGGQGRRFTGMSDRGKPQGVAMVTSDGGEHWHQVQLKDLPVSGFFLNESIGWMVTPEGIWRTDESGLSWKRIWGQKGVTRVWFVDPEHGFACGTEKRAWRTSDGGHKWTPLEVLESIKSREEYTGFGWIWFSGANGVIIGQSRPPRRIRADVPRWVDPEDPDRLKEWPALTIMLQTRDNGKTWNADTASVFGSMTRVRSRLSGDWFGLLEFHEEFEIPSEFYRLGNQGAKSVFKQKDRQMTDFWIGADGMYLGAVALPGKLSYTPVPGKLKIIRSRDLKLWEEMKVDYRAVARRVVLGGSPDGESVWAATDTGMILKRVTR